VATSSMRIELLIRTLIVLLCAAALQTAPVCAETAPSPERPNILWISVEDMSPDLGCYGDRYAITPNIDRLAAQGVRYTRCFTHAGVCAPSRSGIITGMYPTTIGTHHMRCKGVPPANVKCFTEYLRAAGYYCTNQSKTDYNFDAPLTAWDENGAKSHWRNRPAGSPFVAVINLTTTHESQVRLPDGGFARRTAALAADERHDPAKAVLPPYYPDTPVVRRDWARYHDLITAMDKQVGKILKDLEHDGLSDNTIVFFWSDHGRGLPRAKRWLYDSGTHIPLIVRWPGKRDRGATNDDLVAAIDFGPTVLSLASVPIPKHIQGRAFLGPAKGPPREYIFGARDRMDETYDIIRSVRDKRYKYLKNYEPQKTYAQPIEYMDQMPTMKELRRLNADEKLTGPPALFFRATKPVEELFDTDADPHEIQNLADSPAHQDVLHRLRAAHEAWRKETADLGLIPEKELWEKMRPGGKWSVTATPKVTVQTDTGRVEISCATGGASIAFAVGDEKPPRWRLYTEPLVMPASGRLQVVACRLGYRDSEVIDQKIAGSAGK
jgi:N-sulfoglucosamine sulfohydrolase